MTVWELKISKSCFFFLKSKKAALHKNPHKYQFRRVSMICKRSRNDIEIQ